MNLIERSQKWWYRRTVKDGVYMVAIPMAVLFVIKAIGVCNQSGRYATVNSTCGAEFVYASLDFGIILLAAALGGLLGVDFQNHENEKKKGGGMYTDTPKFL